MNIILLGGTGFIGRHLAPALRQDGHNVIQMGRSAYQCSENLTQLLKSQDVVIQMSGANIGERWNETYKQELYNSRIDATHQLAQALSQLKTPPKQVIAVSAIGLYPQRPCGEPIDESCQDIDDGFLGQLGQAWERASEHLAPKPLIMRLGVVLGKDGGALAKMLPAFQFGFGARIASGEQCFSWVHIDDVVNAFRWAIAHPDLKEPINVTAPQPLTQTEFGKTLARVLKRPFWLKLSEKMLTLIFGEGAQILMHSSCVLPTRLEKQGFKFQYPDAQSALKHLLNRP